MAEPFGDDFRVDAGEQHQGCVAVSEVVEAEVGWAAIRSELDAWFASYRQDAGDAKGRDLRERFRSGNDRQHFAAWWELYVHRLLRRLYPERRIICEPELPGVDGRPDFVVLSEDDTRPELIVGCVTTLSGIIDERDEKQAVVGYVLDTINEIESEEFFVNLDVTVIGDEWPQKGEIQRPIEAWLGTLDHATERDRVGERRRDRKQISFRGWTIHLSPIPKKTPKAGDRLYGIGPGGGGFINDAHYLKTTTKEKARRYRGAPAPLVIAVAPTSPLLSGDDVRTALLG